MVLVFVVYQILFAVIVKYGITVYSSIDKNVISIDEQINLKLSIAGADFLSEPKLPKIDDFNIIKIAQFTGSDFSKGSPILYTVFEHILIPLRKGNLIIPKIPVRYKGFENYSDE